MDDMDDGWSTQVRAAVLASPAAGFAAAADVPISPERTTDSLSPFAAHAVMSTPTKWEAAEALASVAIPFAPKGLRDRMADRVLFDGRQMLDLIDDPTRFAEASDDRFSIVTRRACTTMRIVLSRENALAAHGCEDLDLHPDHPRSPFAAEEVRESFAEVVWAASRIGITGMKHPDKWGEGFRSAVRYLAFATHYAVAVQREIEPDRLKGLADAGIAAFCRAHAQHPVVDKPKGWLNEHGRSVVELFETASKAAVSMKKALPSALKAVVDLAATGRLEALDSDRRHWTVPYTGDPTISMVATAAAEGLRHDLDAELGREAAVVRKSLVDALSRDVGEQRAATVLAMAAKEIERCAADGQGPCPATEDEISFARQIVETMPGFCRHVLKVDPEFMDGLVPALPDVAVGEHRRAVETVVEIARGTEAVNVRGACGAMNAFGLAEAMQGASGLAAKGIEEATVRLAVQAASMGRRAVLEHPCADAAIRVLEIEAAKGSGEAVARPGLPPLQRMVDDLAVAAKGPRTAFRPFEATMENIRF